MSSQLKIDSARANGAKSHGPKTGEGRKISSQNALKHGLYSASVVLSTESREEYDQLLAAYSEHFLPEGPVEFHLVEEMVDAKWREHRLRAIEADLIEDAMIDAKKRLDLEYVKYDDIIKLSSAYHSLAYAPALALLTRQESRLERAYSRALKNLLELQRLRKPPSTPEQKTQERTESQTRTPPACSPAPPRNNERQTRNEKPETILQPKTRDGKPATSNEQQAGNENLDTPPLSC